MDERRRVGQPEVSTTDTSTTGPRGPVRPTGPSILEARARGGLSDRQLLPEWHEPLARGEHLEDSAPLSLIGGLLGIEQTGVPAGWLRAGDLIAVGSLIAGCTLTAMTLGPAGLLLTVAMEAMAAAGGALVAQELDRPVRRHASASASDELPDEATTLAILDEELQRSRKARVPLGVLLMAPDGPADLAALEHIAERAANSLREEDTLGRQGSECLLAVLPGFGASLASLVAQRIRLATPPEVTVSIGVAATDLAPKADLPELVKMAAQALYRASKRGGNGVVVARLPRR